jgi:hypothetical protein
MISFDGGLIRVTCGALGNFCDCLATETEVVVAAGLGSAAAFLAVLGFEGKTWSRTLLGIP